MLAILITGNKKAYLINNINNYGYKRNDNSVTLASLTGRETCHAIRN